MSTMLKKRNTSRIDEVIARNIDFEVTLADIAIRNEKRAWIVAGCSVISSLCLIGGYFYVLPLKEKVPYLVLADAYSGTSSLARLTDDVVNRQVTTSEAINRSNIAHFLLARESYDLGLTNMRDWPTVMTMAAPNVSGPYRYLHSVANEHSPYKRYGANKAIRVKLLSIVLIGAGINETPKGATVRFQRSVYDKANGGTAPLDGKIATMEFSYKPNLRMDDQSRIENPLGFQVTSYRVDNDYGTNIPAEVQAPNESLPAKTPDPQSGQSMDPDDLPSEMPMTTPTGTEFQKIDVIPLSSQPTAASTHVSRATAGKSAQRSATLGRHHR
jgi:type IV secretion system protein VirB8